MGQGTLTLFEEFAAQLGAENHDMANDTIRLALITTSVASISATQATPTWSDFSAAEVATGNGYTTPGAALANKTYSEAGGVATFDADNVVWSQNALGPTNIKTAILYNDTNASDMAIGFIDMTTDGGTTAISLVAGDISVAWNASGIFRITVQAPS